MKPCEYCGEPVGRLDSEDAILVRFPDRADLVMPDQTFHRECKVRMLVGSLGHQLGLCCCPGKPNILGDPPGLTEREAARTAAAFYRERCSGRRAPPVTSRSPEDPRPRQPCEDET